MIDPLISPEDPAAVEIVNVHGNSNAVLVCDHASNRVPQQLANLGLRPSELSDHISWDPGAAGVARNLSQQLDAPLILSAYSRLVIDCNRPLSHKDSIAEMSAGIKISGNQGLTPEHKNSRITELFNPYHQSIHQLLDARSYRPSLILSIHSFTPTLNHKQRPWQLGICYGKDNRLAVLMLKALSREKDIVVGNNEPYAIDDDIDYTLPVHAESRGLMHVMIEIRQDKISTDGAAAEWATRLAISYNEIEAEALYRLARSSLSSSL